MYNRRMQLNHLHLHVSNVARSRDFYERFFGLRDHVMYGDILFMTDEGRFDLALAPAQHIEPFPGWFHFGFRLPDAEHVRRLHADMTASNVPIVQDLEDQDDLVSFRCQDPDGYTIEVYWE